MQTEIGCYLCRHKGYCVTFRAIKNDVLTSPVLNFGKSDSWALLFGLLAEECRVGPEEVTEEGGASIPTPRS